MTSPLANIITELRRRRVFRVAAFYGGIAFVVSDLDTKGNLGDVT